jgi:hypothetical protein
MNDQVNAQELDALVVESGKKADGSPFTVFYLGRFIDCLTIASNGLEVGQRVKIRGTVRSSLWTSRKGSQRENRYVADAAVISAGTPA